MWISIKGREKGAWELFRDGKESHFLHPSLFSPPSAGFELDARERPFWLSVLRRPVLGESRIGWLRLMLHSPGQALGGAAPTATVATPNVRALHTSFAKDAGMWDRRA